MIDTMKKILPVVILFVILFSTFGTSSFVFAQIATPSATPTTTPIPTGTSSATTKGGLDTSTSSATLPVTGAYDSLIFMVIGGLMFIGLAGVVRVKLVESFEE